MPESEAALEAACRLEAKKRGYLFLKWVSPGISGVPDRLLFKFDGEVILVELKRQGGRLSPQQKRRITQLQNHGQRVEVVYNLQQFKALL